MTSENIRCSQQRPPVDAETSRLARCSQQRSVVTPHRLMVAKLPTWQSSRSPSALLVPRDVFGHGIQGLTTALDEAPTISIRPSRFLMPFGIVREASRFTCSWHCQRGAHLRQWNPAISSRSVRPDVFSLTLSTALLAVFSLSQDFLVARCLTRFPLQRAPC